MSNRFEKELAQEILENHGVDRGASVPMDEVLKRLWREPGFADLGGGPPELGQVLISFLPDRKLFEAKTPEEVAQAVNEAVESCPIISMSIPLAKVFCAWMERVVELAEAREAQRRGIGVAPISDEHRQ